MSVITEELLDEAAEIFWASGGGIRASLKVTLNAVLPDILEEVAKVAENCVIFPRHELSFEEQVLLAGRAEQAGRVIRALSEDTGTVQERGR